jgi:phosphotransferase system IIB component
MSIQARPKRLSVTQEDPGKAVQRNLKPGTAGCGAKQRTIGQEVVADRIRRQIEAELGDLSGNKRGECIAVGARPGAVLVGSTSKCRSPHMVSPRRYAAVG